MFCRGDLERQTKEAFFNRLKSEYQVMEVHKKDDPTVGTTDCCQPFASVRRTRRTTGVIDELTMPRRIHLLLHAQATEITEITAIMPQFHHQRCLVKTDIDMIITTQIGMCPYVLCR